MIKPVKQRRQLAQQYVGDINYEHTVDTCQTKLYSVHECFASILSLV